MGKLALKIWENQYETIKKIPKKSQREKLALAILDYAFTGKHDKLEYPLDVIMQSMYIGLTLKNQGGAPVGNKNNRYTTLVQPLYNPCNNVDTTLEQPLLENKKEENINKKEESINNIISSDKSSDIIVKINDILTKYNLSKIRDLTDERKRKLKERCKSVGGFENFIGQLDVALAESSFLRGDNDRGWQADFDFFLNKSKWQKVLEGKYKDKSEIGKKQGFYEGVFAGCVKNGSEFLESFDD